MRWSIMDFPRTFVDEIAFEETALLCKNCVWHNEHNIVLRMFSLKNLDFKDILTRIQILATGLSIDIICGIVLRSYGKWIVKNIINQSWLFIRQLQINSVVAMHRRTYYLLCLCSDHEYLNYDDVPISTSSHRKASSQWLVAAIAAPVFWSLSPTDPRPPPPSKRATKGHRPPNGRSRPRRSSSTVYRFSRDRSPAWPLRPPWCSRLRRLRTVFRRSSNRSHRRPSDPLILLRLLIPIPIPPDRSLSKWNRSGVRRRRRRRRRREQPCSVIVTSSSRHGSRVLRQIRAANPRRQWYIRLRCRLQPSSAVVSRLNFRRRSTIVARFFRASPSRLRAPKGNRCSRKGWQKWGTAPTRDAIIAPPKRPTIFRRAATEGEGEAAGWHPAEVRWILVSDQLRRILLRQLSRQTRK